VIRPRLGAEERKPEGNPSLVSVARLDPIKRLEDVIAALATTGLEKAVLHIVGKGPDEARLRARVAELQVSSRVRFHGVLSDEQVAELCASADLFVLASANEGLPTSLIEAYARRLPVVASDIPGNRAVVDVAGSPYLHGVGDVDGLARAIREAAGTRVDDDAYQRIYSTFAWERRVQELETIYQGRYPFSKDAN
jgi:glycosyltransferase involved in cell wall biosynthesis